MDLDALAIRFNRLEAKVARYEEMLESILKEYHEFKARQAEREAAAQTVADALPAETYTGEPAPVEERGDAVHLGDGSPPTT